MITISFNLANLFWFSFCSNSRLQAYNLENEYDYVYDMGVILNWVNDFEVVEEGRPWLEIGGINICWILLKAEEVLESLKKKWYLKN